MSKKPELKPPLDPSEIEVVKDAWPRFMRAVRQLAKGGPRPAPKEAKGGKAGKRKKRA